MCGNERGRARERARTQQVHAHLSMRAETLLDDVVRRAERGVETSSSAPHVQYGIKANMARSQRLRRAQHPCTRIE